MNLWSISGGRLIFSHPAKAVYWEVPDDFTMPSEALLNLAEYLLLKGLGVEVPQRGTRTFGTRNAVSYSGGVDSTAALALIPDPLPIYTQVANPVGNHKLENALLALADVNGIAIVTNSDELAPLLGKSNRGFYGTGGFTVPAVLFADYYDIGVIADGNVLETVYLYSRHGHGTQYTPRKYAPILNRFKAAGIHYAMPCAGLTEVSTTLLAQGARYAMGCMRGEGGVPCGNCAKCYRKGALQGRPIPSCAESEKKLGKEVIPMLPSMLWAVKHKGLRHPILDVLDKDIDWVDKWYSDSINLIPEHLRDYFLSQLRVHGIVTLDDDTAIRNWISC